MGRVEYPGHELRRDVRDAGVCVRSIGLCADCGQGELSCSGAGCGPELLRLRRLEPVRFSVPDHGLRQPHAQVPARLCGQHGHVLDRPERRGRADVLRDWLRGDVLGDKQLPLSSPPSVSVLARGAHSQAHQPNACSDCIAHRPIAQPYARSIIECFALHSSFCCAYTCTHFRAYSCGRRVFGHGLLLPSDEVLQRLHLLECSQLHLRVLRWALCVLHDSIPLQPQIRAFVAGQPGQRDQLDVLYFRLHWRDHFRDDDSREDLHVTHHQHPLVPQQLHQELQSVFHVLDYHLASPVWPRARVLLRCGLHGRGEERAGLTHGLLHSPGDVEYEYEEFLPQRHAHGL